MLEIFCSAAVCKCIVDKYDLRNQNEKNVYLISIYCKLITNKRFTNKSHAKFNAEKTGDRINDKPWNDKISCKYLRIQSLKHYRYILHVNDF